MARSSSSLAVVLLRNGYSPKCTAVELLSAKRWNVTDVPCFLVADPVLTLIERAQWHSLVVHPAKALDRIGWGDLLSTTFRQYVTHDRGGSGTSSDETHEISVGLLKKLVFSLREWSAVVIDPQAKHHLGKPEADVKETHLLLRSSVRTLDAFAGSMDQPGHEMMEGTRKVLLGDQIR